MIMIMIDNDYFSLNLSKKIRFLRGNFAPFISKSFQMGDHFFPFLFPKNSKSLKFVDIRFQELGAKRRLNCTSKVNRQTNTQTYEWKQPGCKEALSGS